MTVDSATGLFAGEFEFTAPLWLWLLPLLLVLTIMFHFVSKARGAKGDSAGLLLTTSGDETRILHPLSHLLTPRFLYDKPRRGIHVIFVTVIACLVISLAEPVLIGEQLPEPPRERDIMFIVDTSVAMILRDYVLDQQRIDRMSLLKGLLDRFVQKLKGERMGVIVFGDEAFTLVPLTQDQHLLRTMLRRIKTTMAGRYNAIGEAIALAVKQAGEQPHRRRVLILLTAASQPTGRITPQSAAQLAKDAGLPLYTIAIGATGYTTEDARKNGLIYRPVNVTLLKSLAEQTGARSYLASDTQTLEQAIHAIEQRESNIGRPPPDYYREPLYHWPLLIGLLLLSLTQVALLLKNYNARRVG